MEGKEGEEQEVLRCREGRKGDLKGAVKSEKCQRRGKGASSPLPVSEGEAPSAS